MQQIETLRQTDSNINKRGSRGVFRTLSNIYKEIFFQKLLIPKSR